MVLKVRIEGNVPEDCHVDSNIGDIGELMSDWDKSIRERLCMRDEDELSLVMRRKTDQPGQWDLYEYDSVPIRKVKRIVKRQEIALNVARDMMTDQEFRDFLDRLTGKGSE